MKRKNLKYSFFLVPHDDGHTKKIEISGRALGFGLGCFILFALVSLFLFYHYIAIEADRAKVARLTEQNIELKEKYSLINAKLDSFAQDFAAVRKVEKIARIKADLPGMGTEIREYGYGGPNVKQWAEEEDEPDSGNGNTIIKNVDYALENLWIKVLNEKKALEEACSVLSKQEDIRLHTPSIAPMRGYISSTFGKRLDPFTNTYKRHTGIDICNRIGTPVKATANGKVVFAGWRNGYGKTIEIDHAYYKTVYAHLHKINVHKWQKVERGELIGTCGRSGRTTGTHLHYEVRINNRPINPVNYIYSEAYY